MGRCIVQAAEDKQANDIVLLDIRKLSTIADYFVICSTDNERQLRAVIEHIDESVQREFGLNPRVEGGSGSGWVVMDYGDLVVHVFSTDQREYYRLESLYRQAVPVVVVQ